MEDVWVDGDVDSPQYRLIQSQRRQLLAEGYTFCDKTRESAATPSLKEVRLCTVPIGRICSWAVVLFAKHSEAW